MSEGKENSRLLSGDGVSSLIQPLTNLDSSSDHHDCLSFSELLRTVLSSNSSFVGGLKGKYQMSQQTLINSKPKAAGGQAEHHPECTKPCVRPSPLSPTALSVPHPAPATPTAASDFDSSAPHKVAETATVDEYSWRKYGQKQVMRTKSFRSYYRCTCSGCHARKKVQQCEDSGHVIDIIYVGQHNHEPPQKKNSKSRGVVASSVIKVGTHVEDPSIQKLSSSDTCKCCADARRSLLKMSGSEHQVSGSPSSDFGKINVEEQHGDVLEVPEQTSSEVQKKNDAESMSKKRKEERESDSDSILKATEEHKISFQDAADERISSYECRWRKYGQKMVKGNSRTRSYYRCTSAGCPARKHVETPINDATATTITFEGKHVHGLPVSKKQHVSEERVLSSTPSLNDASKSLSRQNPATKWSDDTEADLMGEKVMELGGEKALESARTLLSIGIEARPC